MYNAQSERAMTPDKKIEICIPAFNEERIIAEAVHAISAVLESARRKAQITVSDNDSNDKTAAIARAIPNVAVISIRTRGKGAAITAAARRSTADIFGFIDADLSANPEDIIPLLSLVEQGDCDIAIGSRLMDTAMIDRGIFRTLLSRAFNVARKTLVGVAAMDTQCGLKVMNARGREVLADCKEEGWFLDIEFLARAERVRLSIREVPIHWKEKRFADRKSKLSPFRDSIGAFRAMLRIRRRIREQA